MLGDLVLVRRCRAAGPAVGRALTRGLGANFEQNVDSDLAPRDQRPVSVAHESIGPFRARRATSYTSLTSHTGKAVSETISTSTFSDLARRTVPC